jgi:hypothetical protein
VLEAVLLEAMRLYPPAPSLMRIVTRPVKLGDVELAPGATINIPIYVVHRHRQLWQDPLRFDPSRFNPERKATRHRCAYMPFSTGPRNCIGGTFSMIEGKVVLATLLARRDLVLPAACGVALAHAASLVLDDLPSMDDAAVRRGQPCTHRVFPAWAADMAPVFLVTLAYQISLDNPPVPASARINAALELSDAGLMMIQGQVHDMRQDVVVAATAEECLSRCFRLKSA